MSFINFIKNIVYVYTPVIGKDIKNRKVIKRIILRLKNSKSPFFDPVQRKFTEEFYDLILELKTLSTIFRQIYRGNISGDINQKLEFELDVAGYILSKYNHSIQDFDLKNILLDVKEKSSGSIQYLDSTFKGRIKAFSGKNFKVASKYLILNSILADVSLFEYDSLLENINPDDLKDLLFLSGSLPSTYKGGIDPVMNIALDKNHILENFEEMEIIKTIKRIYDIFINDFNSSFLTDVITVLTEDADFSPVIKVHQTDFPIGIQKEKIEKFKIDREKHIMDENHKLVTSRISILFGEQELLSCQVYDDDNNKLLLDAGLSSFKYIDQINIIKSFNKIFFEKTIASVIKEFQLEADFMIKDAKIEFDEVFDSFIVANESSKKFEEDLTVTTLSEIDKYLRTVKSGLLNDQDKLKARIAIKSVNDNADDVIQKTVGYAIKMHTLLVGLSVDITAVHPRILNNVFFFNESNPEFLGKLEEIISILNNFTNLMRAVHVNTNKKIT